MSVIYGNNYGQGGAAPPPKVNFDWINQSWQLFTQAAGIWMIATLIFGAINVIFHILLAMLFAAPEDPAVSSSPVFSMILHSPFAILVQTLTPVGKVLSNVFTLLFGALESACLYFLAVKQVRGETLEYGDIFAGASRFGHMLLFTVILMVAIALGFVACCVGSFVVAGLLFPGQALVADGEDAISAVSKSIDAMKQDWLNASLFVLGLGMLVAISMLPCYLGLLVTYPMYFLSSALAYRDMVGMPGGPGIGNPISGFEAYGQSPPQAGTWPPPPTQMPPPSDQSPPPGGPPSV